MIQYTHWHSFLPRQIKAGIAVSQYHRFSRLLTDQQSFILETSIMLLKLILKCAVPAKLILPKIRRLLHNKLTAYRHGHPARRPGYFWREIRDTVHGGMREPARLEWLLSMTQQKSGPRRKREKELAAMIRRIQGRRREQQT